MRGLILISGVLAGCASQAPVSPEPVTIHRHDFLILGVDQTQQATDYRYCDPCPSPTGKRLPAPAVARVVPSVRIAPSPTQEPLVRKWSIQFDLGKAVVHDLRSVREIATALSANPHASVYVSGHTDALGSVAFNRKLADRRARNVVQALRSEGVVPSRIRFKSFCCIDNPPVANPLARKAVVIVNLDQEGH